MQMSVLRMGRRLLPVALIIPAVIIGSHGATSAQTSPPTPTPAPSPTPTPLPSIDPSHFVLSRWEFPRPAVVLASRIETTTQADAEQAIAHFGPTFLNEGRSTGYFMSSGTPNFDSKGKTHAVYTYYLTSTFPSVDDATAAFNQQKAGWDSAVTVPPAGVTVKQVPLNVGVGDVSSGGLYTETARASDGSVIDGSELFFQRGIYLIEIFQQSLHADAKYATAERSSMIDIARQLDNVASGVVTGPPPPTIPSKPALHILSTRFEQNQLKLNFTTDLSRKPVKQASTGTAIQASTYFVVTAAKPGSKFTVHIKLTRGKTSLARSFTHSMGDYPPDYYRESIYNLTLTVAGRYTLTMKVSSGSVSHTGSATINVTKHAVVARARRSSVPALAVQPAISGHPWVLSHFGNG